jgi:hypothetical protein
MQHLLGPCGVVLGVAVGVLLWGCHSCAAFRVAKGALSMSAMSSTSSSFELGCLPFPPEELPMVGEGKKIHLYESRFLSLFEHAIKVHDSKCVCLGMVSQATSDKSIYTDVVAVASLVHIEAWRRQDVGVEATLRCIGRVQVLGQVPGASIPQESTGSVDDEEPPPPEQKPFLSLLFEPYNDLPVRESDLRDLEGLASEIENLHSQCTKIASGLGLVDEHEGDQEDQGGDLMWGHEEFQEKWDSRTLEQQVNEKLGRLKNLVAVDQDEEERPLLWSSTSEAEERLQLLGFCACFTIPERLRALQIDDTEARLRDSKSQLELRLKTLAAKSALKNAGLV